MIRDQHRIEQQLRRLRKLPGGSEEFHRKWLIVQQQLEKSLADCQSRRESLPPLQLDTELPVSARAEEIGRALNEHQVLVVSGATGSGKSTQLPLIALQAGIGMRGMIGHTQPRRIAARSIASRIAQQLKTPLGNQVGFKIRFSDQTQEKTLIKLMTDGILLAESQTDRFFNQYELIILDEAHERSLNIDFLLGYLKRLLPQRPDLKLIVTSATIDSQRFAGHFSEGGTPVPVIDVEGRSYPVEIQYRPVPTNSQGQPLTDEQQHLLDVIQATACQDAGDQLVFLPTENDIRQIHRKLKGLWSGAQSPEVLPLYARLSPAQQNLIFAPGAKQRIVLATNVAESSLTVPRIRHVIDTGTARISHYAARSKVQRLPIQPVSQASLNQRAGRCGRVGPGICIRLFSQEDYDSRPAFTTPEIRRTNLAAVILQTLALRLGDIGEFPLLDMPHPEAIRDGYKTLFELGAVDAARKLTDRGRELARLPVDPRVGRMLLAAAEEQCLTEILIIASGLETQDPRLRPAEKQAQADQAHQQFAHPDSDFLTWINVWDFFHRLKSELSRGQLRKACEQNFLSWNQMIQWQDIHRQLWQQISDMGLKPGKRRHDYGAIHRSLLSGLLSGIALAGDKNEYTGAGGLKFFIWPGSNLFQARPRWIVANEIVETNRRYARNLAKIDPAWIEPLALHLVKSRLSEPHWSKKRQSVTATEHVSLWGLPIVEGRVVNYATFDPEGARDLFISEALVQENLVGNYEFLNHNRELTAQINDELAKTRRRDLAIDSYTVEQFYQERLPATIHDKVSLTQALKRERQLNSLLLMQRGDLLSLDSGASPNEYPDQVQIGSMHIPLKYRFAPGELDDGATVSIPLAGLGQVDDLQAAWLVPGLIEPRVAALIRSLPKELRRNLVPAPDTAAEVARRLEFGKGNFYQAVAQILSQLGGQKIDSRDFELNKIEDHLKVNLQIVDEQGSVLAQGRSMALIREQLTNQSIRPDTPLLETPDSPWQQDHLQDWTWNELPRKVTIRRGGTELDAFPAIVDQGDSVGLKLSDSPAMADQITRAGLVRLYSLLQRKPLKSQVNWLPDWDRHQIMICRYVPADQLQGGISLLLARLAFVERQAIPRNREEFERPLQNSGERLGIATQEVARWLPKLSQQLHQLHLTLEQAPTRSAATLQDLQQQLNTLMEPGFLESTPWVWLSQYPRYLQAMQIRLEKLSDLAKDQRLTGELAGLWSQYLSTAQSHRNQGLIDPELELYRWMIEEYRVSLFAQQLGTSITVSAARLDKQWKKVQ
jgi:ATP-dependent helicase HrpA